jgi:hypothetical protein
VGAGFCKTGGSIKGSAQFEGFKGYTAVPYTGDKPEAFPVFLNRLCICGGVCKIPVPMGFPVFDAFRSFPAEVFGNDTVIPFYAVFCPGNAI